MIGSMQAGCESLDLTYADVGVDRMQNVDQKESLL